MASKVPVIGKVPSLIPSWINEENGIWIQDSIKLIDFLSDYIQNWLEDNISEKLYDNMSNTVSKYTNKEMYENEVVSLFDEYYKKRGESLLQQLEKINETEKVN
jgi:hypothetical protein